MPATVNHPRNSPADFGNLPPTSLNPFPPPNPRDSERHNFLIFQPEPSVSRALKGTTLEGHIPGGEPPRGHRPGHHHRRQAPQDLRPQHKKSDQLEVADQYVVCVPLALADGEEYTKVSPPHY